MSEALSQPTARVHANSQLPDKSQRLAELAIKQSRQLIPLTSSTSKPLVSSSVDKSKQPKIAAKIIEMTVAPRAVRPQPHSSHLANQSHAGQIKSDSGSTSHLGKFMVLKPGRESITTGAKDVSSPTGDANGKLAKDGQFCMASSTPTALISVSNYVVSVLENKSAALSLSSRSTVDKRSSQSLTQSRSEFFNLMRKTSAHAPAIHSDSCLEVLSPNAETSGDNNKDGHAALSPCVLENGNQMICYGDKYEITEKIKSFSGFRHDSLSFCGSTYPDEEAAFLRSLGWEENGGEDEGLTKEEINVFYLEYMSRGPSLESCQSSRLKCPTMSKFPHAFTGIIISDSSSSESEAGA